MVTTLYQDEQLDIVNDYDQVIGVIDRAEFTTRKDLYSRAVLSFIINNEGKLAILRRTADKFYCPLHLAIVGGGVQATETYEQAIVREIAEEVGLSIAPERLVLKEYLAPKEGWDSQVFKKIYEVRIDQDAIDYNPQDFCELFWLTPQEIIQKSESDTLAYGLEWLIRRYYL